MRPDRAESVYRCIQRLIGTLTGVFIDDEAKLCLGFNARLSCRNAPSYDPRA
jgi:hypothetical protein